ncbi:MAG: hypothetical protein K2X55_02210 [Burkholderiaceae bacterium]|nr:hypothetical protein [Burkholderiaceae bacterium]
MKESCDHHRVSAEGQALGLNFARIADAECAALAGEGEDDERCKSCAFRAGTVPNGCIQTQLDVAKAVVENVPFMCHCDLDARGRPTKICHGWFAVRRVADRMERATGTKMAPAPYEFSQPDALEAP